jgi:hypothetical protein
VLDEELGAGVDRDVASSRMSSAGSARKARAMVSSCFSPALMLLASESSTVS